MSSTTTQARAAQEADEWAQVRRELGGELDALEREVQQASVGVTTSTPPAVTPSYSAAADIGKTAASNFTAWRESAPAVAAEAAEAPKKKICCACPDTRKPRDECVMMKGEEQCADFIEAHKRCLRAEGFDV